MMHYDDRFTSQVIQAFAYDARPRRLYVYFAHGKGVYAYAGVPPSVHRALQGATSKGNYFQARIRDTYASAKLSQAEQSQLNERIAAALGAQMAEDVRDWFRS